MDTKSLAERILGELGDHAMQAMTKPMGLGGLNDLHRERVSIVARLIEGDRPTVPLPAATTGKTDPTKFSIKLMTEILLFTIEGMMLRNASESEAHIKKFQDKLESVLTDFKRDVREEAMAEFTEGSRAADNLMEGTIGRKE